MYYCTCLHHNAIRVSGMCAPLVLMTIVHVHIAASQKQSGQKRYQVNLRSQSAPIQVMLINRASDSSVPVVFCVPPTDGVCPTPPSNPYSLQSFPNLSPTYSIPNTSTSSSSCYSSQGSFSSDHQMALPQYSDTLVQSFTPDKQIGKWGSLLIKMCSAKKTYHKQKNAVACQTTNTNTALINPIKAYFIASLVQLNQLNIYKVPVKKLLSQHSSG